MLVGRVLPDVAGLDKVFDYVVPDDVADRVRVGTMVRVELHGRRVGGWVVGMHSAVGSDRPLKPIAKVTGWGPAEELVELATWAAWRWAGRPRTFLHTASPPVAVRALPPAPAPTAVTPTGPPVSGTVRLPPADDPFPYVVDAADRGSALVLAPSSAAAADLAARLRRAARPVALVPREWARAAAGGCTVVGTRSAAWAPAPELGAVVVVDEHDEAYQEERAPTWHARDVAVERARRARVPVVLTSPCPSLHAGGLGDVTTPSRVAERNGWAVLEVVDRRRDDPRTGLYSERLAAALRSGRRVLCVLNRKGRARLLACAACGELARCEKCGAAVEQHGSGLRCRRCGLERPQVCAACGRTRLRTLRIGVARAREELEALAGEPVADVTGDTGDVPTTRVIVGTEAVLHRIARADVVAFLDFDQELLAPRYRAGEEALALLARASRVVGGRRDNGRVLVQTRVPGHEVLDAALHADPSRFLAPEDARRAAFRMPPHAALAAVSGEAASALVEQLHGRKELDVMGPADGRWLVRADDHITLCDALAATTRPAGRLRVEVDPLRV